MSYTVMNCFHWIGFHIVNYLLETGHHVEGVDDLSSNKKEHLAMFLGRNSSFTRTSKDKPIQNESVIFLGENNFYQDIEAKQILNITKRGASKTPPANIITIHPPLLFGEWMPMDEKGIYDKEQRILFESSYFLTEAVYIKDFISSMFRIHHLVNIPSVLDMYSQNSIENKTEKLENKIFIREIKSTRKSVDHVLNHYRQFKNFYE
ncbi:hypothetical protein [Virgibacillus alimentarius]|uniref:Uncharacterized protein n=1 Tax=Virgibacillus alimentarius TaxID=698769 RepID=A0ABS4S9R4_9BACI|nr:hypothetical protein [Virgibacillus alimentarius]MBP2258251.1 hypothetical protein [Virgibacillus alimentarius]